MNEEQKFPVAGLISVLAGTLAVIISTVSFVLIAYYENYRPGGLADDSFEEGLAGAVFMLALFFSVFGLIPGVIGIFQRNCDKLLAVIGLVFSLFPVFIAVAALMFAYYDDPAFFSPG